MTYIYLKKKRENGRKIQSNIGIPKTNQENPIMEESCWAIPKQCTNVGRRRTKTKHK